MKKKLERQDCRINAEPTQSKYLHSAENPVAHQKQPGFSTNRTRAIRKDANGLGDMQGLLLHY